MSVVNSVDVKYFSGECAAITLNHEDEGYSAALKKAFEIFNDYKTFYKLILATVK